MATDANTREPTRGPGVDAPYIAGVGREYCCRGPLAADAGQLDNYQNVPYGTAAWQRSSRRPNQVENTNSRLRDKGALEPGACRALGVIARTICALAAAVTYNLALAPTESPDSVPVPVENPRMAGRGHAPGANSGPFPSRAPP
ncbi:MAG: hypothetical protein OXE75_09065 [bacterium]|nr:hypothetical protein [bacterium]